MEDIAPDWMLGVGMWLVECWLEVRVMVRGSCLDRGKVGFLEDEERQSARLICVRKISYNCESIQLRCCAWVPRIALPSKFRWGSRVSSDLCNWLERFDDLPKVRSDALESPVNLLSA